MRIVPPSLALLPLIVLWAGHSFAQQPPEDPEKVATVYGALPAKPTTGLVVGELRISFEKTPLLEVGLATNNVVTRHSVGRGDVHDGSTWLCYTIVDGSHRTRLWLTSDDDFGGHPDDLVTGIYVKALKPTDQATDDCPDRSRKLANARFDNGLWLGASLKDIEASLGVAPSAPDGWWRYGHEDQRIDRSRGKPEEIQVTSRFDIRLSKGRVVEIIASQISSS